MKRYVKEYHQIKKNIEGIKEKLDEYIENLCNLMNIYPDNIELEEFINRQKELIINIKTNINKYNRNIKNEAYRLDKRK